MFIELHEKVEDEEEGDAGGEQEVPHSRCERLHRLEQPAGGPRLAGQNPTLVRTGKCEQSLSLYIRLHECLSVCACVSQSTRSFSPRD